MKKFPTLYKKTNTGAIQFWEIFVQEQRGSVDGQAGTINTKYGQLNTDSPQTTFDLITEGKNIGKRMLLQRYNKLKKKHKLSGKNRKRKIKK